MDIYISIYIYKLKDTHPSLPLSPWDKKLALYLVPL